MKIGEVLSKATSTLFSKLGKAILSILAFLLISFVLGLLNIIPFIGMIAMYVLMVPIMFGLTKQFIKIYKNEDVKAFDFLSLGFEKFGMVWRVTGRVYLKYLVVSIVIIVATIIMWTALVAGGAGVISMSSQAVAAGGIGTSIGIILLAVSAIWGLVLSLKYIFVYNELAYNDNATTGKEIVETVAKNMEGNKLKLVGLYLILYILACVISLLMKIPVLGVILTITVFVPFVQFTMIAFYDGVRNEKMPKAEANETIEYNNNIEPQDPIQM